jgi:OmpA-OmpF porin, OOP family
LKIKPIIFSAFILVASTAAAQQKSDSARVFGGAKQYNHWSVGLNVGVTAPTVATGGVNTFNHNQPDLGYGVSLRDQLSHAFGLQLDVHGGTVEGSDNAKFSNPGYTVDDETGLKAGSFKTPFWSATLSGVVNVGSLSFLHRTNAVNFFLTGGGGLAWYAPKTYSDNAQSNLILDYKGQAGTNHDASYVKELVIPIGAGVKFKLSDAFALNVGYTENFIDGFNFTGVHADYPAENKYSYGYAGLEYTFGSKSKPNLDWVNPVAMMYDELYDAALRQEVEALKGRVGNVENAINDLKKDSDGDGVADQFDKCPNTPAGTVVDGSGCPINFPKIDTSLFMRKVAEVATKAYSNIQFEFDSSILKTSSYPTLDVISADLRANPGKATELDGFTSNDEKNGSAASNMRLSRDRANSVKTYLVNSGVNPKRLKIKAFGETHPIADNSTEDGRIMNRRVEFNEINTTLPGSQTDLDPGLVHISGNENAIVTTKKEGKVYMVTAEYYDNKLQRITDGQLSIFLNNNPKVYYGRTNNQFIIGPRKYMAIILFDDNTLIKAEFDIYPTNKLHTLNP